MHLLNIPKLARASNFIKLMVQSTSELPTLMWLCMWPAVMMCIASVVATFVFMVTKDFQGLRRRSRLLDNNMRDENLAFIPLSSCGFESIFGKCKHRLRAKLITMLGDNVSFSRVTKTVTALGQQHEGWKFSIHPAFLMWIWSDLRKV